jgi:hypothetical protein
VAFYLRNEQQTFFGLGTLGAIEDFAVADFNAIELSGDAGLSAGEVSLDDVDRETELTYFL